MWRAHCNVSNSPKASKAGEPGDPDQLSDDEASKFRSGFLRLLYAANDRADVQSTARCLRTGLKMLTFSDVRRPKKLLRYGQGARHVAVLFNNGPLEEKVL